MPSEYLEPPAVGGDARPSPHHAARRAVVRSDDPDVDAELTNVLGRVVRLAAGRRRTHDRTPRPRHRRCSPPTSGTVSHGQSRCSPGASRRRAVHVVTTASLAARPRRTRPRVRSEAFRSDLPIETEDAELFVENSWSTTTSWSAWLTLDLVMTVPWCVMTTLAQADLPADNGILQTVAWRTSSTSPGSARTRRSVYGLVTSGGKVSVGESISLAPR